VLAQKIQEVYGYDKRVNIYSTELRYLTFSLNLGLHYSKSEFIARMDSDDISTPDRLERQLEFMQKNQDISILGTNYNIIDEHGNLIKKINLPLDDKSIKRKLKYGNPICHPSVIFRKKIVIREGGYMGGIYAQDYDLWLRLAQITDVKFANIEDVCLHYRYTGVGEARKNIHAYASAAGALMNSFVASRRISLLPGLLCTIGKSLFLAK
jgi:glycosyltransferase involved in cell wall biosynthesis